MHWWPTPLQLAERQGEVHAACTAVRPELGATSSACACSRVAGGDRWLVGRRSHESPTARGGPPLTDLRVRSQTQQFGEHRAHFALLSIVYSVSLHGPHLNLRIWCSDMQCPTTMCRKMYRRPTGLAIASSRRSMVIHSSVCPPVYHAERRQAACFTNALPAAVTL